MVPIIPEPEHLGNGVMVRLNRVTTQAITPLEYSAQPRCPPQYLSNGSNYTWTRAGGNILQRYSILVLEEKSLRLPFPRILS